MAKNHYFSTISEKIKAESSGSKNWWNLVKRHNFGSFHKSLIAIGPVVSEEKIFM
jgi:hypothetical protein